MISFLLLVAAPGLYAQNPDATYKEAERSEREKAQAEQARQAQAQSAAMPGDGDVTYEQVLADPDNAELNLRWARRQVLEGDVKGASATLERVLLVKPNLLKGRLLYAVVLYRLDNLDESEQQLKTLKAVPLSADVAAEADQFLALIQARRRRLHWDAFLSLGFGYDENRNSASATGKALFGGGEVQLNPSAMRRDDTNITFMGSLGGRQDLGLQGGHELFQSFTYYQGEQTLVKSLNLKAYSLRAGGVYKSPYVDVTPELIYDHVQLAQQTFLRNFGGDVRFARKNSERVDTFLQVAYQYQDFERTTTAPTGDQRSGNQWDFLVGRGWWFCPKMKLTGSYGYGIKNAAFLYNAYDRHSLALEHKWLLGRGLFAVTTLNAYYDRYRGFDPLIITSTRRDDIYRARFLFGLPFSLFHAALKGFAGNVSFENYWALSNMPNYAYTNNKVAGAISYSWGY